MSDPDTELAARLDAFGALLAAAGRRAPDQDGYESIESTRLSLGTALTADPAATRRLAGRLAGRIFRLLTLEPSTTSQLTDPLIGAIGHRATLAVLVPLLEQGGWRQRGNAATAAYHLRFHRDPAPLAALRAQDRGGPVDDGRLRERYRETLRRSLLPAEPYADLWPRFWLAAAACFTACPDREVRDGLALAFPLAHPDHLPAAAPLLAEARRIAEHHPELGGHRRLLADSTGYGAAL
ncbi:hypothetical protein HUT16_04440 [Kitasatospora sp. NA04385]|uniref:hypothetical protein n=1 Tax=Kitasatospora sp. NA04385 TaxID=2742135 RepID=UPI00159258BC|nr:hypothetical protein [Kitasatospora sp. NA04385]QKW18417.1 hypothetical protein HUT16_04440 [Kitasatospora sp. NA04385]